jgi:hypothetical protein
LICWHRRRIHCSGYTCSGFRSGGGRGDVFCGGGWGSDLGFWSVVGYVGDILDVFGDVCCVAGGVAEGGEGAGD